MLTLCLEENIKIDRGDFDQTIKDYKQVYSKADKTVDINKLRIGATNKLISKLSPILEEYAKKNSMKYTNFRHFKKLNKLFPKKTKIH